MDSTSKNISLDAYIGHQNEEGNPVIISIFIGDGSSITIYLDDLITKFMGNAYPEIDEDAYEALIGGMEKSISRLKDRL